MKFLTIKPVSLLFTGALLIVSQIAGAQTDIRNLTAIGANATQASVGRFINDWLTDPLNAGFENGSEEEQEIWDICTDYADQASTASTQDELASALTLLDYVANEEVAAVGSGLTDTGHDQVASVLGRLQTLRSGTPALASLNGVSLLSGGAAGADFSKLSYFANASYGDGEKDRTRNEQGFDFDSQALTFGVDYRFRDDLIAGVALGWGQSDVDIDGSLGGTESDTLSLTLYGTYYVDEWYVDLSFGYAQYDYESVRNLPIASMMWSNQALASDTDGDSLNYSIGGGYTQLLKGWNADYSLHLNSVDATVDGYSEKGGSLALNVSDQDVESLQAVLSAQFSKAFSKDWGVIQPYGGIEIHQEFEDETRVVTASYKLDQGNNQFSFTSDDADDTYFLISVGSSFVLSQGKQLFVNLDHIAGLDDVDSNTLTAGIRFEL